MVLICSFKLCVLLEFKFLFCQIRMESENIFAKLFICLIIALAMKWEWRLYRVTVETVRSQKGKREIASTHKVMDSM